MLSNEIKQHRILKGEFFCMLFIFYELNINLI